MKNFLKLLLLCLLLLISACQNSSAPTKAEEGDSGNRSDVSISVDSYIQLDGKTIEKILLQVVADTRTLNSKQTQAYFQKLDFLIHLECYELCKVKTKNEEPSFLQNK